MAAGAILRPADHDQHAEPRRGRRQVQDADEFRLCAGEGYRALRHRRHGRNRPSVAAMSAGAKVISWSVQNGAPTPARARCDPVSKPGAYNIRMVAALGSSVAPTSHTASAEIGRAHV